MRKQAKDPVSFRLAKPFLEQLGAAAKEAGVSRAEYIEKLVIESLSKTEGAVVRQELEETRSELVRLREDIATLAFAVVTGERASSVEEARAWVARTFRRK